MLFKCQCKDCMLFNDKEGEGWEDTGNGFHIIYCKDGKVRAAELKEGCPHFEKFEYVQ